ncbi:MAG: hypothetical protein ABIP45_12145 [Knoellia sp.]
MSRHRGGDVPTGSGRHHRPRPADRLNLAFATVVGLLSGGFLAVRLFVGGAIGMSDQGDGVRLLCSLGLRQGNPFNSATTDYVYLTWYRHQWYGETCGSAGSGESYDSSQLWLLHVARWLTSTLSWSGGLDLRALGIVFCVLVAVAMGVLFFLLPGSRLARALGVAAVMLVISDGAFAGYFVSAYSEPAALVGVLAILLTGLIFWRSPKPSWRTVIPLGLACLFTITAKTQAASFLLTVIPFLLLRPTWGAPIHIRLDHRRAEGRQVNFRHRFTAATASRWPALVAALVLVTATAAYLQAQPDRFRVQNSYAAVFLEMLPHSPNPQQDLAHLGLDPAFIASSGVPINAPESAARQLSFSGFEQKASPVQTTGIYLRQPLRLNGMLERGLAGMGVLRADYIFSYPPSAGLPPSSQECRVCLLQGTWKFLFGGSGSLILFTTLAAMGICARLLLVGIDQQHRAIGAVGLLLAFSSMVQFWVVMLTEGASDLIKHLVLTNFMTALLMVMAGYAFSLLRLAKKDRDRPLDGASQSLARL